MEYKWTALTVTTVGTLLVGISGRILVVGLPLIAVQLAAGADQVIWITQGYTFASTATQMVVGRITDVFGRVKLFTMGFMVFTVGSIVSALSFDPNQLIAFRVVQGVGAAIISTNASAIVTDSSPRNELGTMLGINQMARRIGNVAGLTLSGLILSVIDWRGLFYVNIPIGIFGTLWAHRRLKEIGARDVSAKMDWAGFALFTTGLSLTLLAITFLGYGPSALAQGIGLLLAGLVLIAVFIRVELGSSSPLLDPKLFKIRMFAAGNIAQFLNSLVWGGLLLLLAFYLEVGLGYPPLQTGLGLIPLDGTYIVFTLIGGRLADKYSVRVLTTVGLMVNCVGLFYMTAFGQSTSFYDVAVALVLVGVGNGLFTSPNLKAIMGSVPANRVGVASGLRNTMFDVGVAASYGLVLLFITIGIPYGTFSLLLEGLLPQSALALAKSEFFSGFRAAVLILAVIGVIAIVPSALRESSGLPRTGRRASQGEAAEPAGTS